MSSQVLSISEAGQSTRLSGQPDPVFDHQYNKKNSFVCSSAISICAYCILSCHWASLRRVWLNLLYVLSSSGIYTLIRFPLSFAFSRINSLSSLSISWYCWCSEASVMLVALCRTVASMSTPFLYSKPSTGPSTPDVSHQCCTEGMDHPTRPAGNSPNAAQDAIGLLYHKSLLLAHSHLVFYKDSQIFLFKAAF